MGVVMNLESLPLSCLPLKSRDLLSCLLDTPKIIPNEPDKLPRDWQGLAHLVNISTQNKDYIKQNARQKTNEVLKLWQQDPTATIGQLFNYLARLDRFDAYDDLLEDLRESISTGQFVVNTQNQIAINNNNNSSNRNVYEQEKSKAITYDDVPGYEQNYDAFVLYAKQDKTFVDDLIGRMTAAGFYLCTVDRLQAGHSTQYAPVAELIKKRCQRIILVLSPDFLSSQANTFYTDYATAVSIESDRHKILPIVYRECQLPSHLMFYHKLYYNEGVERAMYDFWLKLKQSLAQVRSTAPPIANSVSNTTTAPLPQIKIVELPTTTSTQSNINDYLDANIFLPSPPRSISMNGLDSMNNLKTDSTSLSSVSQKSAYSENKRKKKPGKITRAFYSLFKPKMSA